MSLEESYKEYISKNNLFSPKDRLLLAVSGGVDSVVLCELCHRLGYQFAIAHCNFNLRGEHSGSDELFVKALASQYNVPFFSRSFNTKKVASEKKTSIEETARNLRYDWFHELLDKDRSPIPKDQLPTYVLTGHHADDNLETVIMHFFRGTGIKGMRGILPRRERIIRPLLFARRKEIEDYATLHQLKFVTDHTNLEEEYARNFFRNRIIPQIREVFPAAEQNIIHNITKMGEVEQVYNDAMSRYKEKLLERKGNEVHIPVLKLKKTSPLHTITYEIIKDYGFTSHQTSEVLALLESETGKYTSSQTHRVIRNRNWLIIAPNEPRDASNILIDEQDKNIEFDLGKLVLRKIAHSHEKIDKESNKVQLDLKDIEYPLVLRKWKAADYFYPLGMKKKKKVARFLIDLKLSKTEKEKIWVIESNKKILWVIGYRIDERFKITETTSQLLVLELFGNK